MGLLYEMVVKKRKAAQLVKEAGLWKKTADHRPERKLAAARAMTAAPSYSKI